MITFLYVFIVVLALDRAAFWKFANWSRQFRGKDPPFSYVHSLFPRILLTISGCITFSLAKTSSSHGVELFIVSVILIGGSHGYLYYRVLSRERSDLP